MMRVSELEGALLDYWVLRAEGWEDDRPQDMQMRRDGECCVAGLPPKHAVSGHLWRSPSTNWAQGGPLIERERINVHPRSDYSNRPHWGAVGEDDDWDRMQRGETALIAAMRYVVVRKFGEEVPDSADDVLLS